MESTTQAKESRPDRESEKPNPALDPLQLIWTILNSPSWAEKTELRKLALAAADLIRTLKTQAAAKKALSASIILGRAVERLGDAAAAVSIDVDPQDMM